MINAWVACYLQTFPPDLRPCWKHLKKSSENHPISSHGLEDQIGAFLKWGVPMGTPSSHFFSDFRIFSDVSMNFNDINHPAGVPAIRNPPLNHDTCPKVYPLFEPRTPLFRSQSAASTRSALLLTGTHLPQWLGIVARNGHELIIMIGLDHSYVGLFYCNIIYIY